MNSALAFAVLAMVGWGLWAALATVATRSMAPETAMIVSYATSTAIALGYVLSLRQDALAFPRTGVLVAAVAGVFAGVGGVAFYAGLDQGRTAVVTTVSALYFVVAAAVGIAVFGDSLDASDAAGIALAVLAVLLLAR
jgi:uncharacterized membrane protein